MNEPILSRQCEPFFDVPMSYSRLTTWNQCAHKGHQVYDLGFVSGLEASHNVKGKAVHETVEHLHNTIGTQLWSMPNDEAHQLARILLTKNWQKKMGGKLEVEFVKKYSQHVAGMYEEVRKERERVTGQPCKAPWRTKLFLTEYKPLLKDKDVILDDIMRRMNYVAYTPLPIVFKESYRHIYNYVQLARSFDEPEELYIEYEHDPLVTFFGEFPQDMQVPYMSREFVFPFRGAIDQIWFYVEKGTDRIYLYDVKTARAGFKTADIVEHDQLWLYANHIYLEFGRLPERQGILDTQLGHVPDIHPTLEQLELFRERFEAKILKMAKAKVERMYPPAGDDSKVLCNFCDVGNHGACKWYQNPDVPYTPNQ